MPGREGVALASMGIYVDQPRVPARDARARRRDSGLAARLRPQHRARGRREPARVRLSVRGRRDEGAALLARRRHRRRVLQREHGAHSREPRAQPLRRGLADLDLSAAGAGREVHPRRGRPPRARDQLDDRRRLHRLRRRRARVACCSSACSSTRAPRCAGPSCCPRSRSAAAATSRTRSSTKAAAFRTAPSSAAIATPTVSTSTSPTRASCS